MPPKRMTANPVRPARYRPGKPVGPEVSSDDDDDHSEEGDEENEVKNEALPPPPKITSFRPDATKIANSLKNVDLTERRRQAAAEEAARVKAQQAQLAAAEEGFETESSEAESDEDEGGSGGDDDADEDEEEESSEEEEQPRRALLRPTFIKKDKRVTGATNTADQQDPEAERLLQEAERKKAADEIVQEQIRKEAELRAAGRKDWDDDEVGEIDEVDDTDGLDPEGELAAWKLRELQRVKRDRDAIEQAEKEREEIERRRNLSKAEREAEDREFLEQQQKEKEGKGKMGYMQKYFHKGAFFQDDAKEQGLDRRDIMGSRFQDDVTNRELLPQYMQIRDMTRLGRKGRTKYKDLKTEDTGRWGQFDEGRRKGGNGVMEGDDDRFRPDRPGDGGATGANASVVAERRATKGVEGAPEGPKAMTSASARGTQRQDDEDRGDSYRPRSSDRERRHQDDDGYAYRDRRDDEDRRYRGHDRRDSPRRRRSRSQAMPRSRSRSRSRSPRRHHSRDRYRDRDDGPSRRKRSASPHHSRRYRDEERDVGHEKRRRVDVR
ncbi:MAG: hypothetical protein M1823_004740 [Watsoniomyces obsoletus]|nr:MAG: hypothetical protein M1823_004740 [Watsoniomyces obsoletus]